MTNMQGVKSFLKKALIVVALGLLIFGYIWFYVPFSDSGVKAGILNNIKHKGLLFKTYEGELIQSGFRPGQTGLQSNEFQFSVDDKKVAEQLMSMSGRQVQLHYKEYFGTLPWRGYTKFIVDSIISIEPIIIPNQEEIPPYTVQ